MIFKKCNKCGEEKEHSEFNKKKEKMQHNCKNCANMISKQWYAKNKTNKDVKSKLYKRINDKEKYLQNMANYIKKHYGCGFCREKESCCLDFHHLSNSTKERNVSTWVRCKNLKKVLEEISKCVCVCANCHRKIHAKKIVCSKNCIDKDHLKNLVAEFQKENPWIWKFNRIKKNKNNFKNECKLCNTKTNNEKYCSIYCYKKSHKKDLRPSKEQLENDINKMSSSDLINKYKVSLNTIKRWMKNYAKK